MKTRHGTSNPGNTFFPTGKQSARNSARIDEDESDDRDRVQPSSVPSPRTRQHDCHDRTLERDHDRRRRLPKPDPIVTKAISSSTTTHPLSDLYDGAAPTREQLHSFPRPGHGVRAQGRIGTCRSQETTDIGISGQFAIRGRSFVIRWVSQGAAECFRRCYARRCRFCQS